VRRAGGRHDDAGRYAELHIRDLADSEEAREYVRALHRSGRFLGYSVHARVSRAGNSHVVIFRAIDKTHARQHVLQKYGPDRAKWPYDPRRRGGSSAAM
jgi:hypothetical protein